MFEYLWSVWRAIQLGLKLQPEMVEIVATYPNAGWVAFGVVMTAGISLLFGQSVILFLNQVSPGRFVLSLVGNGLLLVVGGFFWAASIWVIGNWLFVEEPEFSVVLKLIALSYAPLVFGFLILMPYLGPFVQRLLYAWSFVIAVRAVSFSFEVTFWQSLVCTGIGWLLLMVITATIGRPIVAVRNRVWHRISKTPMNATAQELLQQFALEQSTTPTPPTTPKGDKP